MAGTLKIKSANETSVLEITPWETADPARGLDYLDVTLTATGLRATTRVYNFLYAAHLVDIPSFLHDIAANWRGWAGEKRWESVEGDLKMICTSSPLGNIQVAVELRSHVADPFIWEVRYHLSLESWQLDVLASEAKKCLSYD